MTKLATRDNAAHSASRLARLLRDGQPLIEIAHEFEALTLFIEALKPPVDVLKFPLKPELLLSEIGEADEQGYTTTTTEEG